MTRIDTRRTTGRQKRPLVETGGSVARGAAPRAARPSMPSPGARSAAPPDPLVEAARRARRFARATYSGFKVGAALETADGAIVSGCNVENATYGLTVCAERVAMFKALSEGHRRFRRIAIVADTAQPTPPCGACRQILWEFGGNLEVVLANLREETGRVALAELLPLPFDRRRLGGKRARRRNAGVTGG